MGTDVHDSTNQNSQNGLKNIDVVPHIAQVLKKYCCCNNVDF